MGLFGAKKVAAPKRKGPPPMSLDNCSQHIDNKVKGVDAKIAECTVELEKYRQQLKTPGADQRALKMRALNMLRRKKMYEQQRDQMLNTQFNVDQAAFNTDNMQVTMQTVNAMSSAAKTMQHQVKKLDIDEIENMQDDMEEIMQDMNEVQDTMGRMYGVPADFDEAELDAEFAAMGEFDMESENVGTASYLPEMDAVPSGALAAPPVAKVPGGLEL